MRETTANYERKKSQTASKSPCQLHIILKLVPVGMEKYDEPYTVIVAYLLHLAEASIKFPPVPPYASIL